ncbi:MAG: hypothetical protein ACHQUC_10085 [Chlamydiales bacterium]
MTNSTAIQQGLLGLPYHLSDRLADYHQNIFSDSATSRASKWNLTWTWIPNTALNLVNSLLAPVIALVRLAVAAVFGIIGHAETAKRHLASCVSTLTDDLGASIVRLFYFSFQNSHSCFNAIQGGGDGASSSNAGSTSGNKESSSSSRSEDRLNAGTVPATSSSSGPETSGSSGLVGSLARFPHERVHPITPTKEAVHGVVARLATQSSEYFKILTAHGKKDGWIERDEVSRQLQSAAGAVFLCTEPVLLIDAVSRSCRAHGLRQSCEGFSDLCSAILGAPIYRYQDGAFATIRREFSEVEQRVMQEVMAQHEWERFIDPIKNSSEEAYRDRQYILARDFQYFDVLVDFLIGLVPQTGAGAASHSPSTKAASYQLPEGEIVRDVYESLIPYMQKRLDWEENEAKRKGNHSYRRDPRENAQSTAAWLASSVFRSSQPQILVHAMMDLVEKQELEQPELEPLVAYSIGGSLFTLINLILDPSISLKENLPDDAGRVTQLAKQIRDFKLPLGNQLQNDDSLFDLRFVLLSQIASR